MSGVDDNGDCSEVFAEAVEALRAAWDRAPPEPELSAFLGVTRPSPPALLLALIRAELLARRHRSSPRPVRHYLEVAIPADAFGPGRGPGSAYRVVAEELIRHRLELHGASKEELRSEVPKELRDLVEAWSSRFSNPTAAWDGRRSDDIEPDEEGDANSDRPWRKGDRIGRFELIGVIGRGAFGEVWRARGAEPDRDVAIKILKRGSVDRDSKQRFKREAEVLARLDHRYIARIYDAGLVRGLPYIAMEYIEGKPLTKFCDDEKLTLERRLELVARICEGVQHAHQRGLMHRDLKPDNILVTKESHHPKDLAPTDDLLVVSRRDTEITLAVPKIVDFGLAKRISPSVRFLDASITVELGKIMGTPEYMAPEQAGHEQGEVNQQADIFALGVILYELLVGTLPLTKEELRRGAIEEMVRMLRSAPRPDPATKLSSVPAEQIREYAYQRGELKPSEFAKTLQGRVRHLCGKAMRLEPARRFSSAATMAIDIRNYLEDRDFIEAAEEPWADRARRHLRRHRLAYVAAAAVASTMLAGLAGTTWQWRAAVAQRTRAEVANEGLVRTAAELVNLADSLFEHLRPLRTPPDEDIRRLADASKPLAEALGRSHEHVLQIENLRAGVLKWSGRLDEAERVYAEIDAELALSMPVDHERRIQNAFNRAIVETSRGLALRKGARALSGAEAEARRAEADAALERAAARLAAIRDLASSADEVSEERLLEIDSELALTLTRLSRHEESLPAYERALAGMEKLLAPKHWRVADTSGGYGTSLMRMGRPLEAARALDRAYEAYAANATWGPGHESTLRVAARRSIALARGGACDESWAALRRACDAAREAGAPREGGGIQELQDAELELRRICASQVDGSVAEWLRLSGQ